LDEAEMRSDLPKVLGRSARGMRGTSANLTVSATTLSCSAPICSTWRTSSGEAVSTSRVPS